MGWLVGGVWIGAVVLAAVILAFCLYELSWKAKRLRRDLARLDGLSESLAGVQRRVAELRAAQSRIAADTAPSGRG